MRYIHIHTNLINQKLWDARSNSSPQGHGAIKLLYYIKSLDANGSGYGDVIVVDAAQILERTCSIVRRWIKSGITLGIFRSVIKLKKGLYRIYYSSILNICKRYKITDLGAIPIIRVEDLKNIKFKATEADTIRYQKRSYYAAIKGKKLRKLRTIEPDKILCSKSKRILFLSSRFVYLASGVLAYGASQKYIANQVGYSKSTIQRRLSNNYRKFRGLNPVTKKQQCVCAFGDLEGLEYSEEYFEQSQELISYGRYHKPSSINSCSNRIFKSHVNIYSIDVDLKKQRFLRWRLNRLWNCFESQSNNVRIK